MRPHGIAPQLRAQVRYYAHRIVRLQGAVVVHPVPARVAPLLEFITGDPIRVFDRQRREYTVSPQAVVVGMQTRGQIQLELQGSIECFVILFQPAGFHQLFATPMHELTDRNSAARAVLGAAVSDLEAKLQDCLSFEQQVTVADDFLTRCLANARDRDGISTAALEILRQPGQVSISTLAQQTGYSIRQFERCFLRQLGITPKLFARIARFEAALDHKARWTGKSWTEVAHTMGYHDQMHMVHDFADFCRETPTRILSQFETLFGDPRTIPVWDDTRLVL